MQLAMGIQIKFWLEPYTVGLRQEPALKSETSWRPHWSCWGPGLCRFDTRVASSASLFWEMCSTLQCSSNFRCLKATILTMTCKAPLDRPQLTFWSHLGPFSPPPHSSPAPPSSPDTPDLLHPRALCTSHLLCLVPSPSSIHLANSLTPNLCLNVTLSNEAHPAIHPLSPTHPLISAFSCSWHYSPSNTHHLLTTHVVYFPFPTNNYPM